MATHPSIQAPQEARHDLRAIEPPTASPNRAITILRSLHWIVAIALVAAAVTYVVSSRIPPTYRSTATIRIQSQPVNGSLGDAVTASNNLASQYTQVVDAASVIAPAAAALHITTGELQSAVSAGTVNAQNLISIAAEASSPTQAALRAAAVARAFVSFVEQSNAEQARSLVRKANSGLVDSTQMTSAERQSVLGSVAADALAAQPSVELLGSPAPGDKVQPRPTLYAAIAFVAVALAMMQLFATLRRRPRS